MLTISGKSMKDCRLNNNRIISFILIVVVFLTSYGAGFFYMKNWGGKPQFYQKYMYPSVSIACGKGFTDYSVGRGHKKLDDFLNVRTDNFSCTDFPEELPTLKNGYFTAHRYLLTTVGWYWSLLGISWSGLAGFSALLFAITNSIIFCLFRLAFGNLGAMSCTFFTIISPLHLTNLPNIRDYAKAPFFLAFFVVSGILALAANTMSGKRKLSLCAIAGIIVGLGFGFRSDLLACVPLFVLLSFFFWGLWKWEQWRQRLYGLLLFFTFFVGSAYPIFKYVEAGNFGHVVLLGQMTPFDKTLKVENSLYDFGHLYKDRLAILIINAYGELAFPDISPATVYSNNYDLIGKSYVKLLAEKFPADVLTKTYAATFAILKLPFETKFPYYWNMRKIENYNNYTKKFFATLNNVKENMLIVVVPIFMIGILTVSMKSLRIGFFFLALLLSMSGVSIIQYHVRHIFYMEFVGIMLVGLSFKFLWSLILSIYYRHFSVVEIKKIVKNITVFSGVSLCIAIIPLFLLRTYQDHNFSSLVNRYLSAKTEAIDYKEIAIGKNKMFFAVNLSPPQSAKKIYNSNMRCDYLRVDFAASKKTISFPVTFSYHSDVSPGFNITRSISIDLNAAHNKKITLFIPVFQERPPGTFRRNQKTYTSFTGIELPLEAKPFLTGITRLQHKEKFPLLLNLFLPGNWQSYTLHSTLSFESRAEDTI